MTLRRLPVLLAALLISLPALAGDWSLGGGSVRFHTPDNWMTIMQGQGEPEIIVFQVPDPSPTGQNTLSRVTVTVAKAASEQAFRQFVDGAHQHASKLPDYKPDNAKHGDTLRYTAQENGVTNVYVEHYARVDGHAVKVRCIRRQELDQTFRPRMRQPGRSVALTH
jgi:hypothetical protein